VHVAWVGFLKGVKLQEEEKTIEEQETSSGFRFLSWYALGPMASPSSDFIEKSRVCYIPGESAWTWNGSKNRLKFIKKKYFPDF